MKLHIYRKRVFPLLFAIVLLCGCTAVDPSHSVSNSGAISAAGAVASDSTGGTPVVTNNGVTAQVSAKHADISKRDARGTWDNASAVHISLSGASVHIDGKGADFAEGVLTVRKGGVYVLSGSFSGSICVDADKDDKIQLVLSGADIACDNGPAVTVLQADKVFLTVANGTKNTLTDAAAYAKQDGDGEPDACIFSKDDLTINGAGALTVTGNYGHGVVSKDALVIHDAQLTVTAADDGLKSNDGTAVSGDAALTVHATHDAVETNGDCIIESGTIILNAGNDGLHGDAGVYVNGGSIDVQTCTEGLEGHVICLSDGIVSIVSSDDGVNASGSEDTQELDKHDSIPGAIIAILGGTVTVSASGDGLDSNGDLLLAGGDVRISIDMHTGNAALDYNGGCSLTGGTLAASGGTDNLQSVKSDAGMPVLCAAAESEQPKGTSVILTDEGGRTLLTFMPGHSWQSVILHAPGMSAGDTVTLFAGETEICTVAIDSAWTTYGNVKMRAD